MPIPKPGKTESKNDFIARCMGDDTMVTEFADDTQRAAVCNTKWQENMKLETKNIDGVEIFETGTWKGVPYNESDLDEMIDNFNNGVAEPYITIDHSSKATDQFKDALQALALGFVKKMERRGNKLVAGFKQVPKTIAELIEAGALKKKSIEFFRHHIANGKLYKNVLQGVTFHGANGLPEVNTLSDFLSLYKSNLQTMDKNEDGIVSISNIDKEDKNSTMETIELKRDEYTDLFKKSSQYDVVQHENETLKKENFKLNDNNKELKEKNAEMQKLVDEVEKSKTEDLKKEAESFISKKCTEGKIKPAYKERYISEYIQYKKAEEKVFNSFIDDIESRGQIIDLSPTNSNSTDGNVTSFKYDPDKLDYKAGATINYDELETNIQALMKAKNITWEQAALECNAVIPDEIPKEAPNGVSS